MPLNEEQILQALADGEPRRIYGGRPYPVYSDLQKRGLISMEPVVIDEQETAIEIRLVAQSN